MQKAARALSELMLADGESSLFEDEIKTDIEDVMLGATVSVSEIDAIQKTPPRPASGEENIYQKEIEKVSEAVARTERLLRAYTTIAEVVKKRAQTTESAESAGAKRKSRAAMFLDK